MKITPLCYHSHHHFLPFWNSCQNYFETRLWKSGSVLTAWNIILLARLFVRGTETFIPSTQSFIKHVNQVLSTGQIPVSIFNTWTVSWMVRGILRILSVKKLRNHIGKESSSALVTGQGIYLRNKISTKSWFHSCYNPTCSRRWTVRLLLPALSYLHSVEPPAPPLRLASELNGCIQQPQVPRSMFDLSTPGTRQDPARG